MDELTELQAKVEELKAKLATSNKWDDPEFDEEIGVLTQQFSFLTPKTSLGVKKVHDDAIIPKYNYDGDSGFDFYSIQDVVIPPLSRALVPTGLSFQIPEGCEMQIRSKSGLAINQGLMVLNSPGTVDQGYISEIKIIVFNTNQTEFKVTKGMKIAQGVIAPVMCGKFISIDEINVINQTDRGSNGFGSTGI